MNGGDHWGLSESYYNAGNYDDWKDDCDSYKDIWEGYSSGTFDCQTNGPAVAKMVAEKNEMILLIWLITGAATASVLCGVRVGIQTLGTICFIFGTLNIFFMWCMDDTWFLTNFWFQTLGHYLLYFMELGWYCSSFERLEGGAAGGAYDEGGSWMRWWTIFYWGWWIAWCPFVGMFIARVSRGRTIRSILNFSIFIPVLYNFIFLEIYGGAALKMEMIAEQNQLTCSMGAFQLDGKNSYNLPAYSRNICRQLGSQRYTGEPEIFCSQVTKLSCYTDKDWSPQAVIFPLLCQYQDLGKFMCIFVMITLTLYFVASSDSGSMVDDMVTANGLPEPPLLQRWFWAMTEGGAASVLLAAGHLTGNQGNALKALRELSIAVGLPLTVLMCFATLALWRALQYEAKDRRWNSGFKSAAIDIGITLYRPKQSVEPVTKFNIGGGKWDGSGEPGFDGRKVLRTVGCFFVPVLGWWPAIPEVASRRRSKDQGLRLKIGCVAAQICFYMFFLFCLLDAIPVSKEHFEWGACQDKTGACDQASTNNKFYTSTRYGWYRGWTNDNEAGKTVTFEALKAEGIKAGEVTSMTEYNSAMTAAKLGDTMYSSKIWGHGVEESARVDGRGRLMVIGSASFFCFIAFLTVYRTDARLGCGIPGNVVEDFLLSWWFWPGVILQIEEQMQLPLEAVGDVCVYGSEKHTNYLESQQSSSVKKVSNDPGGKQSFDL